MNEQRSDLPRFRGPVVVSREFEAGSVPRTEIVGCLGTDKAMLDAISALVEGGWAVRVFEDRPVAILPAIRRLPRGQAEVLSSAAQCAGALSRALSFAPTPVRSPVRGLQRRINRLSSSALRSQQVPDRWTRRQLTPDRFEDRRSLRHSRYLRAIASPNCKLVGWPIASITERGLRTCDGVEHRLDRIVIVG